MDLPTDTPLSFLGQSCGGYWNRLRIRRVSVALVMPTHEALNQRLYALLVL